MRVESGGGVERGPDVGPERRDVAGAHEARVDDVGADVAVELVLVVVGAVAVVVHEADRRVDERHRRPPRQVSAPPAALDGGRQRVERATDVVDAELEDGARTHHHLVSDAAERAPMNRRHVVTTIHTPTSFFTRYSGNVLQVRCMNL